MARFFDLVLAWLCGDTIVRFAAPTDDDGSAEELARLERRFLIGQQAGGDPQAGWLRQRIRELRARRGVDDPPARRSSK